MKLFSKSKIQIYPTGAWGACHWLFSTTAWLAHILLSPLLQLDAIEKGLTKSNCILYQNLYATTFLRCVQEYPTTIDKKSNSCPLELSAVVDAKRMAMHSISVGGNVATANMAATQARLSDVDDNSSASWKYRFRLLTALVNNSEQFWNKQTSFAVH